MSSAEMDLTGEVEQAWGAFRGRLADHVAAMEPDDVVFIELADVDKDDRLGASPYVQLAAWGEAMVRAEAVSNHYLADRWRLSEEDEEALLRAGWSAPSHAPGEPDDGGSPNFHLDAGLREADRLAVMVVNALREVHGCVHPAFLSAGGLEVEPDAAPPVVVAPDAHDDDPDVLFPDSREELQMAVDRALQAGFDEPLRHDSDGDVPIVHGASVLYVRVASDRPAVDLYAELVLGVENLSRAAEEVAILNRSHPMAKFLLRDDLVTMHFRIVAWPFSPTQLRVAVQSLLEEIDDLARDLTARVGGRRFAEALAVPEEGSGLARVESDLDGPHPGLVALLELLHDGPVAPRMVAALFDQSRVELVGQLVGLRTGRASAEPLDLDVVLGHLRAGLRHVVEREAGVGRSGRRRASQTRQLSLLPEPDEPLDPQLWERESS